MSPFSRSHPDTGDVQAFREANRRTQASFSFEWLRYEVRDKREDVPVFIEKTGLRPPALNGKRVLDAGCGLGRYLEVAARYAHEVVGIDLGLGLERADVAHLSHVHRVQGDLLKPPFRHAAFDVAFSIGVLHHTPSTEDAFRSVAKRVAPDGVFSVWVYEHQQWFRALVSELVRAVTTRLPHRVLEALCFLAVPKGIIEYHLRRSPATRPLARLIGLFPPVQVDPRWRVVLCDTFDWYSPEYQFHHSGAEVRGWFLSEDFKDIVDLPFPVSLVGTKKHT